MQQHAAPLAVAPPAATSNKRSRDMGVDEDTRLASCSKLALGASPKQSPAVLLASPQLDARDSAPRQEQDQAAQEELAWGCQASIGGRPYMEDAHVAGELVAPGGPHRLFAVFDGHGGPGVARFLADNACDAVAEAMVKHPLDSQKALSSAFIDLDVALPNAELEGSTATVVVIDDSKITCANCGDSRAVLCRDGETIALSEDHKPDRQDEEERITAAGGRVLHNNGPRVMGLLSMSRALGDKWLRKYGVIPEPDVRVQERHAEDEFLIVASDGLWGAVSNEEAVSITRRCMRRALSKGASRAAVTRIAAKVLARTAMRLGSRDNVTVVVVDLSDTRAPSLSARAARTWSGSSDEDVSLVASEELSLPGSPLQEAAAAPLWSRPLSLSPSPSPVPRPALDRPLRSAPCWSQAPQACALTVAASQPLRHSGVVRRMLIEHPWKREQDAGAASSGLLLRSAEGLLLEVLPISVAAT